MDGIGSGIGSPDWITGRIRDRITEKKRKTVSFFKVTGTIVQKIIRLTYNLYRNVNKTKELTLA